MYQHRVYLNMQFSLTGKKLDWIWTSLTGRHGPAACLRGLYMIVLGSVLLPLPLFQRANTVEINSEVLFLIQLWLERQAFNSSVFSFAKGLPWWLSGKESARQCRRPGFDPWVGNIPLEKEMVTHSSVLDWEIPWTEEPWQATVHGVAKESDMTQWLNNFHLQIGKCCPQMVKNLPTMQKTWVWYLGQKDPLEKEIATHSNILAWRIPWEKPGQATVAESWTRLSD